MSSNIEFNAPALLKTSAAQAIDALDRGDMREAREILVVIEKTSSQLVEWFKLLVKSGHDVPSDKTWTKFIHRKE